MPHELLDEERVPRSLSIDLLGEPRLEVPPGPPGDQLRDFVAMKPLELDDLCELFAVRVRDERAQRCKAPVLRGSERSHDEYSRRKWSA